MYEHEYCRPVTFEKIRRGDVPSIRMRKQLQDSTPPVFVAVDVYFSFERTEKSQEHETMRTMTNLLS